ncbi:MAG TPA: hypothetical protein VIK75_02485 [Calditerricola sp.]
MPRLCRMRVANVWYDHGKKQIPDLLFDFAGKSSLLVLANGGGKTLLVQLLLQTVLPNVPHNARKLAQLFHPKPFVGHVAVEWLLDAAGEERRFLCAGFCFAQGSADEGGIRYFTYLFDYGEDALLTIASLPFVVTEENGLVRPIGYQEFRDWLRTKAPLPVEIFSQNRAYQDRLRQYAVLPEEWQNIRLINGAEGGVEKFFERSRTTGQLLENLLIPSVEQVIYQREEERRELVTAFARYRNLLLDIPRIKQNLADFQVIRDHADAAVAEVEAFARARRAYEEKTAFLASLAKTFAFEAQEAREKLVALGHRLDEVKRALNEAEWKIRSYEVFQKEMRYRAAQEEAERRRTECERQRAAEEALKQRENELRALYHYGEALRASEEVAGYRHRLEQLDKAEPEMTAELERAKRRLKAVWVQRRRLLEERQRRLEDRQEQVKRAIADANRKRQELERQKEELSFQLGEVREWFRQYEKARAGARRTVPEAMLDDPEASFRAVEEALTVLDRRQEELQHERKETEAKFRRVDETLRALEQEQARLDEQRAALDRRWEEMKRAEEQCRGLLAGAGCIVRSLHAEQDRALAFVRHRHKETRDRRVACQIERAKLQEKWALLENRGYYVPHPELLAVKQILERHGVAAVLGSEWLAAQPLSDAEKAALLKRQPLLPYALLVEEDQLSALPHALRGGKELSPDFPLLFLVKKEAALSPADHAAALLPIWSDELYLYQPSSVRLYVSASAFASYRDQMRERLADIGREWEKWVGEEREAEYLKAHIEAFFHHYPPAKVAALQDERTAVMRRLDDIQAQQERIRLERERLAEMREMLREHLDQVVQEKAEKTAQRQTLEEYLRWHREYPHRQGEEAKLKRELEVRQEAIQKVAETIGRLQEEHGEILVQRREVARTLREHDEEYHRYRLDVLAGGEDNVSAEDAVDPAAVEDSYRVAKAAVDAVQAQLDRRQQDRSALEDLLEKAVQAYNDHWEQVRQTGIALDWLTAQQRVVTKEELREAQEARMLQARVAEQAQTEWRQAQQQADVAKGIWEHFAKEIKCTFNRSPYPFSPHRHEEEIRAFTREKEEGERQRQALEREMRAVQRWLEEAEEAGQRIQGALGDGATDFLAQGGVLEREAWEAYGRGPVEAAHKALDERQQALYDMERQRLCVQRAFAQYLQRLEQTRNPHVHQFRRAVQALMEEERLYDHDYVETQFLRIFEALDSYQRKWELDLEERAKNFDHLVNLCLRRAKTVYAAIADLPKNSRIPLYGREVQVIRLEWRMEEEESAERMKQYLEGALNDLQRWKTEGMADDELDRRMEDMLRTRNLVNVIAPIADCRVLVYKPRQEAVVRRERLEYAPWEEVVRWSGGEEYSVYMAMFMVLISHIRTQLTGNHRAWKTIVADNPFGKASSSHILETVFQVAAANRIQLICLTAHKEEDILVRFPVVYSLQLRSMFGKEYLRAEEVAGKVEPGFYRIDG